MAEKPFEMTEQQFTTAYRTAGLAFAITFLNELSEREVELRSTGKLNKYVEQLFKILNAAGIDTVVGGTRARVYALLSIIRAGQDRINQLLNIGAESTRMTPAVRASALLQLSKLK